MPATVHLDVFMGEQQIGHVHLSPGHPMEVGREGAGCRIGDPAMSRRHFLLTQRDDDLLLEDLGSSGGTFLNGAPVAGATVLAHGDRIEAGDTTFVVTLDQGSADHIDGTTWHVHEPPPGYFVIGHLGLQREGGGAFAETVVCKEDSSPNRPRWMNTPSSNASACGCSRPILRSPVPVRRLNSRPCLASCCAWHSPTRALR
ncbi:MAG: FHA domain-containing protein [Burkholderiaceae bacterium]|nr:FHA domain-containing protein [Burkholderiaceae bacterium]